MRCLLATLAVLLVTVPAAGAATVTDGPLRADADGDRVTLTQGSTTLEGTASGPVRLEAAGGGSIRVVVDGTSITFAAPDGERFYGFGERSNVVQGRGQAIDNYVSDGPNVERDRQFVKASVPPWAITDRDDATYFPVPWLLSSRGYGALVEGSDRSTLDMTGAAAWTARTEGAALSLRVFAGPTMAGALRRFTAATGRQPAPAAPWDFGPWFQTGQPNVVSVEEEAAIARTLREADAPVSVAETQMHYLPCGAQRGNEELEKARTASFHAFGLARLVYFNPALCRSYSSVYDEAAAAGALQEDATGQPFLYTAFVGGSGPLGFTQEPLALFDFTAPSAEPLYEKLVRAALAFGHDGFMEDFGENSPPVVTAADGTPGAALHNRYPVDYHCAVRRIQQRLERPIVRFQRSGWTGAAACAEVVWGGDPTTVWGFDGLRSAVRQALSIGLSGIARWGSDIGGYNTFGPDEQLTPELLQRWIAFGAVSPVMRTKRSGLAVPSYTRPQVFDDAILPVWRRWAKFHTQLNAYLLGADAQYRATGMPIVRALALRWPRDERAGAVDDAFLLGDALLAAPVLDEGATSRKVYLPAGRWVDLTNAYEPKAGGLRLRRPSILDGRREIEAAAPLGTLPLYARAGGVIALLEPDVDTLAPYGDDVVHATDRAGRMRVLAFPRGRSTGRLYAGQRLRSAETRRGWTLTASKRRTYRLQATLGTLRRPFRPCAVRGAGHWSVRGGVLRATFTKRLVVLRRC